MLVIGPVVFGAGLAIQSQMGSPMAPTELDAPVDDGGVEPGWPVESSIAATASWASSSAEGPAGAGASGDQ